MTFAHLTTVGFAESFAAAAGVVTWVALVLTYHRGWRKSGRRERWRLGIFAAGVGAAIAVVVPPLEHLAEDLVSAHMVQHVALILLSAPAIALSRPVETLLRGISRKARKRAGGWRRSARLTPSTTSRLVRPVTAWLLYGLAIWFWHGSGPYELAARHTWAHLIEHSLFLGAALAFWSIILGAVRVSAGFRILMVFTTAFHSVLLGALLTFSDNAWYPSYVGSTLALGLDPLADQRFAGLLMWIPGGLVYTGAGLWLLTSWLGSQSAVGVAAVRSTEREKATF